MTHDTSSTSSRQKRRSVLKTLFLLLGVTLLLASAALTAFADFSIENQVSYVGANRFPLSVKYDISSADGTTKATLLHTQDEFIDIRGGPRRNVSSISTEGIRVQFDESSTFQRNEFGDVKGSITRLITYTDQCSIAPTFFAPTLYLADLNHRGNKAPALRFSGFNSQGNTVDYECNVYDPETRQMLSVRHTATLSPDASGFIEIPYFPVELIAIIRDLTGYKEAPFLLENFTINPHLTAPTSSNVWYQYLYNGYNDNITVIHPSVDLFNPYTQDLRDYLSNSLHPEVTVIDQSFDFTEWLGSAFGFFNTPLFGDFTLGGLVATVLGVGLLFAFLRFFAGG